MNRTGSIVAAVIVTTVTLCVLAGVLASGIVTALGTHLVR